MPENYYLVGIGGIGMSGIAKLLLRAGNEVNGSDLKESSITAQLRELGMEISIGHQPEKIRRADKVVYSSAIKEDNPQIQEALRLRIPLIRRAQALADLMQGKMVVTVAGSHGKTTTASLAAYLLLESGFMPTIAVGGILKNIDTNAYSGSGDFFVAEADESDGSFLYYQPKYSIITNIDHEHLDYYRNFENELDAFRQFVARTKHDGCLFCCGDDLHLKNMVKGYQNKYLLFGLSENADIYPKKIEMDGLSSRFDCFCKDKFVGKFYLALGGRHNISNALSVIALGLELGVDLKTIKGVLAGYQGSRRRLEVKFNKSGVLVIDDYAHHPTEIKAALSAVKSLKHKRLIAVFQPHRYSRTKLLLDDFGKSFELADYVIVTDIYPADEAPISGLEAKNVADKIIQYFPGKRVSFLPKGQILEHLLKDIQHQDIILTLGAGDIVKLSDELGEKI
jgi:UDP-N-acetylmuramate--alanine ligase